MAQGSTGALPRELILDLGSNVTMKLVLIPAGKFIMGSMESSSDAWSNGAEAPPHEVTITKPFYMAVTHVTEAQWDQVMGTQQTFKDPNRPICGRSWADASEFCRKLSGKTGKTVLLPTEAQWEYACRAGTTTRFSFGDDAAAIPEYARTRESVYGEDGKVLDRAKVHEVSKHKPNPWGLYDMHGNVTQWCSDWYAEYDGKPVTDPEGPEQGVGPVDVHRKVARGGSYFLKASECASASRHAYVPQDHRVTNGIRVVTKVE